MNLLYFTPFLYHLPSATHLKEGKGRNELLVSPVLFFVFWRTLAESGCLLPKSSASHGESSLSSFWSAVSEQLGIKPNNTNKLLENRHTEK